MAMRLQTATEFLVTYGWAFTIIAIVLLALYTSGFFNPSTYSSQQCVLSSGFNCLSFFMSTNGLLSVNLQQSQNNAINVTAIGCNVNGTLTHMIKPYNPLAPASNQVFIPIGGNYTFNVQCYGNGGPVSGNTLSIFTGVLTLNYTNEVTQLPGTSIGRVIVKVT